jgi:hypothetical protein
LGQQWLDFMNEEKMEKPSLALEKCEQPEEVQRIELDPEKGIDIVITTNPDVRLRPDAAAFKPAKVVLEKDGKVIADLQEELPPKYKFVFVPEKGEKIWRCDKKYLPAIIMPEKWGSNKNILSLFHEIGHALCGSSKLDAMDNRIEDLKLEVMQIEREMSAGKTKEEVNDKLENLMEQVNQLEADYLKLQAKDERNAWARALQIVREFRRKGIDLIAPFRGETPKKTRENLDNIIHRLSLGSYEKLHIRDEGLKSLEGIFTKKYNEEIAKEAQKISKEASEEAAKL